jgi:hypothetical protein
MSKLSRILATSIALAVVSAGYAQKEGGVEAGEQSPPPLLRAAVFVQNRAGKDFEEKLDVLNDMVTARLTEKGFSIISHQDVVSRFRESRDEVDAMEKKLREAEKAGGTVESAVANASALRLSQMMGGDFLAVATINSHGSEVRTFKGEGTVYGSDTAVQIDTLRIALKILEGNQGGSVYADVVEVAVKTPILKNLDIKSSDTANALLSECAAKLGDRIGSKIEEIRNVRVKTTPVVQFSMKCNVEGADVILDGGSIGSLMGGDFVRFSAAPGLHTMRVSCDGFTPWERTVNLSNASQFTVTLEFTPTGLERWKNVQAFNQHMAKAKQDAEMEKTERLAGVDIAKEQSTADAKSTVLLAEGKKSMLEKSSVKIEEIGTLNVDGKGGSFGAGEILNLVMSCF